MMFVLPALGAGWAAAPERKMPSLPGEHQELKHIGTAHFFVMPSEPAGR
ncbi:hypothetical protein GXN76_02290 [Kroppenstedtia pulmonis]|uniref:Uncharacterized protein n=1 Tax=Kroppenstedtia pulmonis TaxID=1380685 RepID=A0A7D4C4U4_9BACL|nr:hypothetical protein [Kroppenstedtia pulmonis]QKG83416.1 hypothetical protein GXN76_02290 [Kroppenstedtia pulmonis]